MNNYFMNIKVNGSPLAYFFKLAIFLFGLWVLLSGKWEAEFLIVGAAAALVIAYICMPLLTVKNKTTGKKYYILGIKVRRIIPYALWLFKEIIVSGVELSFAVMKKHMDTEPEIVVFKTSFENPMAIAVLANSIILTPGTITLDATGDGEFLVHALTPKAAKELTSGRMQNKVAKLFEEEPTYKVMGYKPLLGEE